MAPDAQPWPFESGKEVLGRVIEAQEAERARVARDLHDEIGQALTSVLLGLHLAQESLSKDDIDLPDARQRVNEARQLVIEALEQARSLAFELRPTVLDDVGLVAAIERLTDKLRERSTTQIEFAVEGLDPSTRLPAEIETVVYRIVQETLTNVMRHAEASTASVLLIVTGDGVRVVVEDDGRGFSAPHGSLGIAGMIERAALVGGHVTIDSRPGKGTIAVLEVPLE